MQFIALYYWYINPNNYHTSNPSIILFFTKSL